MIKLLLSLLCLFIFTNGAFPQWSVLASDKTERKVNWGPKWDGKFDPPQVERLMEVGDWLRDYGQSIYGTNGGPWYPEKWGGSTYKENKAYLHIADDEIFELKLTPLSNKITRIKCLTGELVSFEQNDKSINIKIGKPGKKSVSRLVEISFSKHITGMAPKLSN